MTSILDWIDQAISFPQMSFLRPVFAVSILLVVISLSFDLIFAVFSRIFK